MKAILKLVFEKEIPDDKGKYHKEFYQKVVEDRDIGKLYFGFDLFSNNPREIEIEFVDGNDY